LIENFFTLYGGLVSSVQPSSETHKLLACLLPCLLFLQVIRAQPPNAGVWSKQPKSSSRVTREPNGGQDPARENLVQQPTTTAEKSLSLSCSSSSFPAVLCAPLQPDEAKPCDAGQVQLEIHLSAPFSP